MPAFPFVGVLTQTCSLQELSTVARAAGIVVAVWSTCTYVCIHAWMLHRAWSDPFSSHPLTFLLSFSFRERSSATFVASCSRLFSSRSCCSSMARRAACSRCRETRPEHARIYVRVYVCTVTGYQLLTQLYTSRVFCVPAAQPPVPSTSCCSLPLVPWLPSAGSGSTCGGKMVLYVCVCVRLYSMSAAVCFVCNR